MRSRLFLIGALLVSASDLAYAQDTAAVAANDGIDEIIVTATRTGETKAQATPLALSVFSADALSRSGIGNVKDLMAQTPNLNVAQVTVSPAIYIRGIGSNNTFAGSDPDVTVQSDGVYIARAFGQFMDFVDVERIEVLRGPQGTLYGRNAIGGTINIISKKPGDEFAGKVQLTGGNYGLIQGQAYLSGPLAKDKLQASIAGNYIRHGNYVDNIVPGGKGVGNANRGGARGALRFTPTDGIEMITRADYNRASERSYSYDHLLAPVAAAPLATSLIGDYSRTALSLSNPKDVTIWGVSHEIDAELSPILSLKSLTAYRKAKYNIFVDADGTEQVVSEVTQNETSKQFSQELALNLNTSAFDAVAGLYYFTDVGRTLLISANPPSALRPAAGANRITFNPRTKTRSYAAFAQGTLHVTDQLSLTAGIRYTRDRKSIDQNVTFVSLNPATPGAAVRPPAILAASDSYDAFTPKFGIDYKITPQIMAYASATRGYKSGGTTATGITPNALTFQPETIWSYEAGLKSELFDRKLRFNLSAFKYDYKNLQVQALIGPGVVNIANAATAKTKGIELETTLKPVRALTLGASFTWLDAEYGTFAQSSIPSALVPFVSGDPRFTLIPPAIPGGAPSGTYDATGNRLNAAPRTTFAANAQYNIDMAGGTAFVRGDFYHQSRAYYDPSNVRIMSQKPYSLLNAAVGYNDEAGQWGVQLMVKNLTQERYLIVTAANGLAPAGLPGAPRTVALQLQKSW